MNDQNRPSKESSTDSPSIIYPSTEKHSNFTRKKSKLSWLSLFLVMARQFVSSFRLMKSSMTVAAGREENYKFRKMLITLLLFGFFFHSEWQQERKLGKEKVLQFFLSSMIFPRSQAEIEKKKQRAEKWILMHGN